MDNNNTSTTNVQEAASFDFKKLLSVFLKNWYWFVISVFLCCSVAVYKVLSTSPQYSRTAILLIKESNVRRASSSEMEALLSQAGQMWENHHLSINCLTEKALQESVQSPAKLPQ